MTLRRTALGALALTLGAVVAVGLIEVSSRGRPVQAPAQLTPAQTRQRLRGSPAPLARLHAQAGQVLGGGANAWRRRLGALRGYPLVINKWASWCGPCRAEFGAFGRVSADMGRRVAFLGLDSGDSSSASATAFLREHPVSYPSYYDATGKLGQETTESPFTPVTVFVARDGSRYVHQGPYPSAAKLRRDVERYALHA